MAKILILLISLVATPLLAAELGDSYVKLFQVQSQMAQKGSASAQYSLGEMYEQGLGTRVDVDQAYKWYEKAASKGDRRAKHKLASRTTGLSTEERMKNSLIAADEANQKAQDKKAQKAEMTKKRAHAQALLKKQQKRKGAYEDGEDL